GTRGQGGDHFAEIERHPVRPRVEPSGDARHVAGAGPALEVALVIPGKARKSTIGDDRLDPGVEGGSEKGVVATEGMAETTNPLAIDLGKRLEKIEGAAVVPDGLHAAAGKSAFSEIVGVIPETGVIGSKRDVTALCQMNGIVQLFLAAQTSRLALAKGGGLV